MQIARIHIIMGIPGICMLDLIHTGHHPTLIITTTLHGCIMILGSATGGIPIIMVPDYHTITPIIPDIMGEGTIPIGIIMQAIIHPSQ